MLRRAFISWLLATVSAGWAPTEATSDVFLLHHGGRVEGEWLNRSQPSAKVYEIKTLTGGRLLIARERVAEVIGQKAEVAEYARVAATYPDTVDGQWEIAEWCRERGLEREREIHLQRIVELDPDHVKARVALGFTHVGGRWVTQRQRRQEQGYEFYRGRWRLVQEIELLEERSRRRQSENEWRGKLVRWRTALAGDANGKAYQQMAAVRDPAAVPALGELLYRERFRPVRLLFVEVLGQIDSGESLSTLIRFSVDDGDEEVRYASLAEVVRRQSPEVTAAYIGMLKDRNNLRVNHAAVALAQLRDPTAIEPLIDALVTIHEYAVRLGGASDAVSASFGKDSAGGSGASFVSGGRTEIVRQPMQNSEVLKALNQLAGGPSFGFNQQAWRNWYVIEKSRLSPFSPQP